MIHYINATRLKMAFLIYRRHCMSLFGLAARALFDSVSDMYPCDVLVCLETMSRVGWGGGCELLVAIVPLDQNDS